MASSPRPNGTPMKRTSKPSSTPTASSRSDPAAKKTAPQPRSPGRSTKGLAEMPSPLFYQGRVHFVRDGAMWTVIAPRTGQRYLDRERLDIGGQLVASPIAGNALYVRSADHLWAFGDKPRDRGHGVVSILLTIGALREAGCDRGCKSLLDLRRRACHRTWRWIGWLPADDRALQTKVCSHPELPHPAKHECESSGPRWSLSSAAHGSLSERRWQSRRACRSRPMRRHHNWSLTTKTDSNCA